MAFNCSILVRCSVSTRLIMSFNTENKVLNWFIVNPFSIVSGIKNGITFVAKISLGIPNFLCVSASLYIPINKDLKIRINTYLGFKNYDLPKMPINTAGSLVGIWGKNGSISSSTSHLSRLSNNFPMHTRQFTRTCTIKKFMSRLFNKYFV